MDTSQIEKTFKVSDRIRLSELPKMDNTETMQKFLQYLHRFLVNKAKSMKQTLNQNPNVTLKENFETPGTKRKISSEQYPCKKNKVDKDVSHMELREKIAHVFFQYIERNSPCEFEKHIDAKYISFIFRDLLKRFLKEFQLETCNRKRAGFKCSYRTGDGIKINIEIKEKSQHIASEHELMNIKLAILDVAKSYFINAHIPNVQIKVD